MNRRSFLGLLGAGAAGFALDPERLLWVPGRKTFFLPTTPKVRQFLVGDVLFGTDGQWRLADAPFRPGEQLGVVTGFDGWGRPRIVTRGPVQARVVVGYERIQNTRQWWKDDGADLEFDTPVTWEQRLITIGQ